MDRLTILLSTEYSPGTGLFCCLFIEKHISKEHYDMQNVWFYPILSEIKSTICTFGVIWSTHIGE